MGVKVGRRKDDPDAWWLFVNWKGKRKAKRVGVGKKARKAADDARIQIEAALARGEGSFFSPAPTTLSATAAAPTFAAYAERWLDVKIRPHQKRRHVVGCRSVLDCHLLPAFGPRPLGSIAPEDVTDLVAAKRNAALAEGTARNIVRTLSAIFNFAIREKKTTGITENPASPLSAFFGGKRGMKLIRPIKRGQVYAREQVGRLFACTEKYYPGDLGELQVKIAFLTGMREGEIFGLQPGDWNFADGFVIINRIVAYRKERGSDDDGLIIEEKSKGGGEAEEVDVPDELCHAVANLLSVRAAEAVVAGKRASPWLFPADIDAAKPKNPAVFYRHVWQPLLTRAGLHHIRFHDARHTYATVALESGVDISYVARQLRHSDISTTQKYYAHFLPGKNRAKANSVAHVVAAARDAAGDPNRWPADAPFRNTGATRPASHTEPVA